MEINTLRGCFAARKRKPSRHQSLEAFVFSKSFAIFSNFYASSSFLKFFSPKTTNVKIIFECQRSVNSRLLSVLSTERCRELISMNGRRSSCIFVTICLTFAIAHKCSHYLFISKSIYIFLFHLPLLGEIK